MIKTLLVLLMAQLSFLAWRRLVVAPRVEATIAVGVIAAAALLAAFPLPPARVEESRAEEVQAAGAAGLPRPGDLTLGGHAGEVLVGLTVRLRGDADELMVYLQDLGSEASTASRPVSVQVDGRPLDVTQCGATCRRASADLRGGERIGVAIGGENGGVARFRLPELRPPAASDVVAEMMRRMHSLQSYRLDESLTSGLGPTVRSKYAFLAPHSYTSEVVQQDGEASKSIVIGETRYVRPSRDARWQKQTGVPGLQVPLFIWDQFQPFTDPWLIDQERIDGLMTREVSFFGGAERGIPVWFRLWIDDDHLVRRAEMRAQGHFMDHRYYDFNAPISIEPPTSG